MLLFTYIPPSDSQFMEFSMPPGPSFKIYDHMPIVECMGNVYFLSKAMWSEFKAVRSNVPSYVIVIRNEFWFPPSGLFAPNQDPSPTAASLIKRQCYLKFAAVVRGAEMDQGITHTPS